VLSLAATAVFAAATLMALDFQPDSRLVPLLATIPGFLCAGVLLVFHMRGLAEPTNWPPRGELLQIGLLIAAVVGIHFAGFLTAVGAYVLVVLATCTSLRLALLPYAASIMAVAWGIARLINIPLP